MHKPARGRDVRKMEKPWTCRTIAHDFGNGYRIEECPPEDWALESQFMGHCLGTGCVGAPTPKTTIAFSLRREDGTPHCTITFYRKGDYALRQPIEYDDFTYSLGQVRGRCNALPKPVYRDMVKTWLESLGVKDFSNTEIEKKIDGMYGNDEDDKYHEEGILDDRTFRNARGY